MKHFSFLLLPDYSNLCLFNALEPLRAANYYIGRTYYTWSLVTLDGQQVHSSSGLTLPVDCALNEVARFKNLDTLIVQSSYNYQSHATPKAILSLQKNRHHFKNLGGFDAGSYLLAKCGLLDGYKATIHWAEIETFCEQFPNIDTTNTRYVIDRNRISSGGATTALDLMIALIRTDHGADIAKQVSDLFVFDTERSENTPQKERTTSLIEESSPRIARALRLIESNLEEPLPIPQLAKQAGISQRQLQRHFATTFKMTLEQYYLRARLRHARQLLRETSLQIFEISIRCGFSSRTSFSRAYKNMFGLSPSDERIRA